MKSRALKFITLIIALIVMSTCIIPTFSTSYEVYAETDGQKQEQEQVKDTNNKLNQSDGWVAILTWPLRALIVGVGQVCQLIVGGLAWVGGGDYNWTLGPEDILFDKVPITSIDFFNFNSDSSLVNAIRKNIAIWYYALRNLSIILLLAILIYVGIKMAISTVAEEEARYKQMLTDWVMSLVILFMLQLIIAFTINVNHTLVSLFEKSQTGLNEYLHTEAGLDKNAKLGDSIEIFKNLALDPGNFAIGFGAAFIYVALVGVTLSFLISYVKRMLTLAFLIIISPLITITYSIDKMKDKQSQALDAWMKEFIFTVLLQPFQCLIYLVFGTSALLIMADRTFGSAIAGLIMILFIKQAETIVRSIFSFDKNTGFLGDSFVAGAVVGQAASTLGNLGKAKDGAKSAGAAPAAKGGNAPKQTEQGRAITTGGGGKAPGAQGGTGGAPAPAGGSGGTAVGVGAGGAGGGAPAVGAGTGGAGGDTPAIGAGAQGGKAGPASKNSKMGAALAQVKNSRAGRLIGKGAGVISAGGRTAGNKASRALGTVRDMGRNAGKTGLGKLAGRTIGGVAKTATKYTLAATGAALGAGAGGMKGAMAGVGLGYALNNIGGNAVGGIKGKVNSRIDKAQARQARQAQAEQSMQERYQEMQAANPNMDMQGATNNILQGLSDGSLDLENFQGTDEEKAYAESVAELKEAYKDQGRTDNGANRQVSMRAAEFGADAQTRSADDVADDMRNRNGGGNPPPSVSPGQGAPNPGSNGSNNTETGGATNTPPVPTRQATGQEAGENNSAGGSGASNGGSKPSTTPEAPITPHTNPPIPPSPKGD